MADFSLAQAIKVANKVVNSKFDRNLTDIEIMIIKGAWQRQEYDEIAAQNQYATSYISQDVAPKLWKLLGDSLEEKVKKSNFKQALKRQWEKSLDADNLDKQIKTGLFYPNTYSKNFNPEIYVRRPEQEKICRETLLQPGSLVRIKAPSLMGKTSLVIQVINQLAKKDYCNVILSFELADRNTHFTQLNKFLRWFCSNISRELGLDSNLDEYWDEEGMGAKVSCTTYFEQYLLVAVDSPLVLCLDNVDLLFPYPEIYEDFFGLLRSWYEKARSRQVWKKLRLVLIHSTDVYIRLNINQSPFNVGLPLELSEFTYEQVQDFAQQYQLNLDVTTIDSLINLVGGHPYLLEMAFSHIKNHSNIQIEQILIEATTETGIYAHHLREHWLNLQQHHDLAIAVHQIVDSNSPILLEPIVAYQLQSMGLVKLSGNLAEIRCHLYRQYFRMRLKEF